MGSVLLLFITKDGVLHTWTCSAQLFPTSTALLERSGREGGMESSCSGNRAAERRGPVRLRVTPCWAWSCRWLLRSLVNGPVDG